MAVALIVAAGRGERLGSGRPKALVTLAGRPMLEWSVAALQALDAVRRIVVALPPGLDPADVSRALAVQSDTVTARLVDLAFARHGAAPVPWAWMGLGSVATVALRFTVIVPFAGSSLLMITEPSGLPTAIAVNCSVMSTLLPAAIVNGKEGDIIDGRYRLLKIGVESADLAYVDGRGRQSIRLSGQ